MEKEEDPLAWIDKSVTGFEKQSTSWLDEDPELKAAKEARERQKAEEVTSEFATVMMMMLLCFFVCCALCTLCACESAFWMLVNSFEQEAAIEARMQMWLKKAAEKKAAEGN